MRNDAPAPSLPPYIKPLLPNGGNGVNGANGYANGGQYNGSYFSPQATNGYTHQLKSTPSHVIGGAEHVTLYHSIDTGQHVHKQT